MDRRGSNLGGGGGSILPIGRSAACAPSAADVDALARAHHRVWPRPSERRLYGRSNRCLRPAEVVRVAVDDDNGPRWSPWGPERKAKEAMALAERPWCERLMGHERSGDCTATGGSAVMPRLLRFSSRVRPEKFQDDFCLCRA
jgi:hypothetical protein